MIEKFYLDLFKQSDLKDRNLLNVIDYYTEACNAPTRHKNEEKIKNFKLEYSCKRGFNREYKRYNEILLNDLYKFILQLNNQEKKYILLAQTILLNYNLIYLNARLKNLEFLETIYKLIEYTYKKKILGNTSTNSTTSTPSPTTTTNTPSSILNSSSTTTTAINTHEHLLLDDLYKISKIYIEIKTQIEYEPSCIAYLIFERLRNNLKSYELIQLLNQFEYESLTKCSLLIPYQTKNLFNLNYQLCYKLNTNYKINEIYYLLNDDQYNLLNTYLILLVNNCELHVINYLNSKLIGILNLKTDIDSLSSSSSSTTTTTTTTNGVVNTNGNVPLSMNYDVKHVLVCYLRKPNLNIEKLNYFNGYFIYELDNRIFKLTFDFKLTLIKHYNTVKLLSSASSTSLSNPNKYIKCIYLLNINHILVQFNTYIDIINLDTNEVTYHYEYKYGIKKILLNKYNQTCYIPDYELIVDDKLFIIIIDNKNSIEIYNFIKSKSTLSIIFNCDISQLYESNSNANNSINESNGIEAQTTNTRSNKYHQHQNMSTNATIDDCYIDEKFYLENLFLLNNKLFFDFNTISLLIRFILINRVTNSFKIINIFNDSQYEIIDYDLQINILKLNQFLNNYILFNSIDDSFIYLYDCGK